MTKKHRIVYAAAVTLLISALGGAVFARSGDDAPPTQAQIANAKAVSGLMLNEVLAALFQEFGETTAANADQGKKAISLIFNDNNRDMRLIGSFGPLLGGQNDRPSGTFETGALTHALAGENTDGVVRVNDTWYYKQSIALSNKFHPACVTCHANFTDQFFASTNNPGQWVGALVLSVPIKTEDQQH